MRFEKYYKEDKEEVPELVLTIGIPGSGKSTWIKQFNQKNYNKYTIVSPDQIRKELTGNISDQSQNAKVMGISKKIARETLESGKSVLLDATNVDTSNRKDFVADMPKGIKLRAKIFYVDPQEAKRRIRKDLSAGKDRADVPVDVMESMIKKFEHTLSVLKDEGFEIIKD